jgi:hypothetical protein
MSASRGKAEITVEVDDFRFFDLGCVKTQKIEKCRELFFSDQVKAMLVRTGALSIAIQKKRSFCRLAKIR